MAKARALEAEISRVIAVNRANCDQLLHALIKLGFRDDDVEPLRGYAVKRHICTLTSFSRHTNIFRLNTNLNRCRVHII